MRSAALLLLLLLAGPLVAAPPVVFWASDPVVPDETVVLMGGDFAADVRVQVGHLADQPSEAPANAPTPTPERWEDVAPVQRGPQCLKFILPKALAPGAYACRVVSGSETSAPVLVNAPDPWWLQGDGGETASPGGWLRIFGRCLSFQGYPGVAQAPDSVALLLPAEGKSLALRPRSADCFALAFDLPNDLPPGEYTVSVHNGFGGQATWRSAGRVTIRPPAAWKTETFRIAELMAGRPGDPKTPGLSCTQALQRALESAKANAGGVIVFPRGRFTVEEPIALPPGTTLKGESMALTSLIWPDLKPMEAPFISGSQFAVEDLAIYITSQHKEVIRSDHSDGVRVRRVRVRANCRFMLGADPSREFRGRKGEYWNEKMGAVVDLVHARNSEVTDCDLYGSALGIRVIDGYRGLIARNTIGYGMNGWNLEAPNGIIMEENDVRGANLSSTGNFLSNFWGNNSENVYFARNRLQHAYGWDREIMTEDGGMTVYFGPIESAEGARLVIAGDPKYVGYRQQGPPATWERAAVLIVSGRGAGQYRRVVSSSGREWQLDRAWDLPPDKSSTVSITSFQGRYLFLDNDWSDGGAFQLYNMSLDCVIARNTCARMDGMFSWGGSGRYGCLPSWCVQFLDNRVTEGNGFAGRSFFVGAVTGGAPRDFPMCRANVFRRNVIENNGRFRLQGSVQDTVLERGTVRHSDEGVLLQGGLKDCLLRENTFEDVAKPLAGDAVQSVTVLPPQ